MQPLRVHRGIAAPLLRRDIDTDQIIPKQFLKSIERTGFGRYLFHDWRVQTDGTPNCDFVLNRPRYAGASILIAGANFGCGSSREHAAWALQDYGIRVVIAPSFADIFRNNAITNGVLPIELSEAVVQTLGERAAQIDRYTIAVDLDDQQLADGISTIAFRVDDAARRRLLQGLDDIGLILQHEEAITAFERLTTLPPPRS